MLLLQRLNDTLNMALDIIRASGDVAWRPISSNAMMKHWCLKPRSWLLVWESRAHVEFNLEQAAVEVLKSYKWKCNGLVGRTYGHGTAEISDEPCKRVTVQKLKIQCK